MNKRILVIDDDQPLRLLYRSELSDDGYEVLTAETAHEGIEKVCANDIALVVLDIEMPDQSGLDALQRIRRAAPGARVILNSAYSTYKADFQSWLADDYLVKSSDLQPLKDTIKRLLEDA